MDDSTIVTAMESESPQSDGLNGLQATANSGISIVVPTFNSPGTLPKLVEEISLHIGPLADRLELIFVDDGSGDDTWATIQDLANKHPWVSGLALLRNYGQHNALLAGLRAATLDIVVTLDDDLQNPPSAVPALLAALDSQTDLVYGVARTERQGTVRNIASRSTKMLMSKALGPEVPKKTSAFRLFRRDLVAASDGANDPFVAIDVLLSWATRRSKFVEVDFAIRTSGQSGYSPTRLIKHAFNMITGYSSRPLRLVSALGFLFALLGFGLVTFVGIRWLTGDAEVAGFTFLAATITLFSGVQLLSLGVLGEYLGRMHFRSMGRPPYVIRTTTAR